MKHGMTATNSAAADADVCRRIMTDVADELSIISRIKTRDFNDIVAAGRLAEALDMIANVHSRNTRTIHIGIARARMSPCSAEAVLTLIDYVGNNYDAILRYEQDIRIDYQDAQAELEEMTAAL